MIDSVGIAAGHGMDGQSSFSGNRRRFSLLHNVQRPNQHPSQWVPGPLSTGVKRPGREADHSPPSSAEVKNGGDIHPPHPVYS
jgi:hypothetical protein